MSCRRNIRKKEEKFLVIKVMGKEFFFVFIFIIIFSLLFSFDDIIKNFSLLTEKKIINDLQFLFPFFRNLCKKNEQKGKKKKNWKFIDWKKDNNWGWKMFLISFFFCNKQIWELFYLVYGRFYKVFKDGKFDIFYTNLEIYFFCKNIQILGNVSFRSNITLVPN